VTPLRQRMLEDLQIRNYAPTTVTAYIRCVAEFAKHFGKSPEFLGPEQIREYQLHLIKEKGVSLPSYIQALSGLRFLYTNTLHLQIDIARIPLPRYESKLPLILTPREVNSQRRLSGCGYGRLGMPQDVGVIGNIAGGVDGRAEPVAVNYWGLNFRRK
jgi:site-specific recombinase XerD